MTIMLTQIAILVILGDVIMTHMTISGEVIMAQMAISGEGL